MPRGGARPNGGRKKGVPNKTTAAMRKEIARTGETPLQYFVRLYRDPKTPAERRDYAAAQALPYMHSKMPVAITHQGNPNQPIAHKHRMIHEVQNITVLEAAKLYEQTVNGEDA